MLSAARSTAPRNVAQGAAKLAAAPHKLWLAVKLGELSVASVLQQLDVNDRPCALPHLASLHRLHHMMQAAGLQ